MKADIFHENFLFLPPFKFYRLLLFQPVWKSAKRLKE